LLNQQAQTSILLLRFIELLKVQLLTIFQQFYQFVVFCFQSFDFVVVFFFFFDEFVQNCLLILKFRIDNHVLAIRAAIIRNIGGRVSTRSRITSILTVYYIHRLLTSLLLALILMRCPRIWKFDCIRAASQHRSISGLTWILSQLRDILGWQLPRILKIPWSRLQMAITRRNRLHNIRRCWVRWSLTALPWLLGHRAAHIVLEAAFSLIVLHAE